jgi:hypothetical protein
MSMLRERLQEAGYFNYDRQASQVLDEYAHSFSSDVQLTMLQLMESAAAEIAIFQFLPRDALTLPRNLHQANIPITRQISILTTRFYYCSPFEPPTAIKQHQNSSTQTTSGLRIFRSSTAMYFGLVPYAVIVHSLIY